MTTFTQLIEGKKFNGKIYGNAKYGYRVYLDGTETFLTPEQAKEAVVWETKEEKRMDTDHEIRKIKEQIKPIEEYLPRVEARLARKIAENSSIVPVLENSVAEAKQKLTDLYSQIDKIREA